MGGQAQASGPDFSLGIAIADVPATGMLAGRVGDQPVLLSSLDGEWFAVDGACTHYGASLGDGLVDGDTVRCPLHHACFSLRTGAVLRAPALDGLGCWQVEVDGERLFIRRRIETDGDQGVRARPEAVERVVIVGGGAAAVACANELRRLGHAGSITMLSADADPPVDRPNLSKDYLAGSAPDEWMPLRPADYYAEQAIDLRLSSEIVAVDRKQRQVRTKSGETFGFDRLLLATGSEPRRLEVPGFDRPEVFTLRSFADARAVAGATKAGSQAVIIGSSFIGMEAAAALRARDVAVHVVGRDAVPFVRQFGESVGRFLRARHEAEGVIFHVGSPVSFDGQAVTLEGGERLAADFVLAGIGVTPRTRIAEEAGIATGDGVLVDARLETNAPGIFAAGDIASYPGPDGGRVRIEHWVTAERQGQVAAANMLGLAQQYEAVPFFWTEQYGLSLRYVGHARKWDELVIDGSVAEGRFIARYFLGGKHRASLGLDRDRDILEDERRLEGAYRLVRERREPGTAEDVGRGPAPATAS